MKQYFQMKQIVATVTLLLLTITFSAHAGENSAPVLLAQNCGTLKGLVYLPQNPAHKRWQIDLHQRKNNVYSNDTFHADEDLIARPGVMELLVKALDNTAFDTCFSFTKSSNGSAELSSIGVVSRDR